MNEALAVIIITGTITIDPAKRDGCLAASVALQAATRSDEPGCITYVFAADPVDDGAISVCELWEDADSLNAHFLHANYFGMRQLFGEWGITGAVTAKHRVDATAPVYVDGVATANF
jgi:quinol monooxygenase YgiN